VLPTGHLLSPNTISFTKDSACVYSAGLTQPIGPLPSAIRAALMFENIAAAAEHDADDPDMPTVTPSPVLTV
jgi:hypothetical protein